jgi:trimeric autotransporter adhesin
MKDTIKNTGWAGLVLLLLSLTTFGCSQAKQPAPNRAGQTYVASQYGTWLTSSSTKVGATGSQAVLVKQATLQLTTGQYVVPFVVGTPITIDRSQANAETVYSTTTENCYAGSINCVITASFAHTHASGEPLTSGTYGLQEAIDAAMSAGGGTVLVDSTWQGPDGSSLIMAATGSTTVVIQDNRSGSTVNYQWNGSAYASRSVSSNADDALPALPSGYNALYTFVASGDQAGTVLHDVSGNGNIGRFGSTAPTWTGTGLYFGGAPVAAGVNLPAALNSDTTFCLVANIPNDYGLMPRFKGFEAFLIGTSFNGQGGVAWTLNSEVIDAYTSQTFQQNGTGETAGIEGEAGTHTWCLVQGLSSNGTVDRTFLDGVENTYTNVGVTGGIQTTGNYALGGNGIQGAAPFGFDGTMYAFVAYPSQLTVTQIQKISDSLLQSVGQRGVPIAPSTALHGGPTLTALGDSITGGYGATAGWPSYLSLTQSIAIANYGIFNLESPGGLAEVLWRDTPNCYAYGGVSLATIDIGINDPQIGWSAQQTMNAILKIAAIDNQANCRVFVGTLISNTNYTTFKNALNPLIRSNSENGNYTVIDFGEDTSLGCDTCNTDINYFRADHVHPTTAGQQLMGEDASNVINSALGKTDSNPNVQSGNSYSMVSGDNFVTMTATAAATIKLPSCTAATGLIYTISNASTGANTITVSGQTSQAITGSATIGQNVTARFVATQISQTTGGCGWLRVE